MENSNISATSANPTAGMEGHAHVGIIATLIEAARRQENLIDALAAAVDSGDETAILHTARNLAANRRKDMPPPARKPGRKKKVSDS
jgi:hypothetical protein